jgi:L-rhamnose-H+ transport protein
MNPNPLLGVFFHWLGGLSSASFYVPYKRIKLWSWEIFWLTGGIFSWVLAPWIGAFIGSKDLLGVVASVPSHTLLICYLCGAGWGLGGLTFGLTMRYLGLSLGMAVALGLTTVIGTMGPPVFRGTLGALASTSSGQITFLGIAVVVVGIIIVALAGGAKEKQLANVSGDAQIPDRGEFHLKKGILIALFSGVMSSFFAFGLDAGGPIREASAAAGTGPLWVGLPVLCVVLAGGFTTNFIWCLYLILKNKSAGEWTGKTAAVSDIKTPLLANYGLAALGGTLWYFQFFFYTMGESQMGKYGFSSWTLHMASIILFSTLWGFALKEWKGTANKTQFMVWLGIGTLVISTVIIGIGNMLAA